MTQMDLGSVVDRVASRSWADVRPLTSVVVATHNRVDYLPGLLDALAAQTIDVEVIVCDDGSTDDTWSWLREHAAQTRLPLLALSVEHTGGPSRPRNTAAAHARTEVLAVTDDDCLPEPGWAAALTARLTSGVAVVQGATHPAEAEHGPWDRAVRVQGPTALFETCNIGFPRARFTELGGFPVFRLLADVPRGFGEDVVFGAQAARAGGFAFADDAVVVHRWIPTSYEQHLDGLRRLSGFPWLAHEVPEVADRLMFGVFLSRRTMEFDAALLSAVAAVAARRPLLATAALPWLRTRWREARGKPGPPGRRLVQLAVADIVAFSALIEGSVRHRRPVL